MYKTNYHPNIPTKEAQVKSIQHIKNNAQVDDYLTELTKKEIIFWAQKLKVDPNKLFCLTDDELDRRLAAVYDENIEQVKYALETERLKGGGSPRGRTAWQILQDAAAEIESSYGETVLGSTLDENFSNGAGVPSAEATIPSPRGLNRTAVTPTEYLACMGHGLGPCLDVMCPFNNSTRSRAAPVASAPMGNVTQVLSRDSSIGLGATGKTITESFLGWQPEGEQISYAPHHRSLPAKGNPMVSYFATDPSMPDLQGDRTNLSQAFDLNEPNFLCSTLNEQAQALSERPYGDGSSFAGYASCSLDDNLEPAVAPNATYNIQNATFMVTPVKPANATRNMENANCNATRNATQNLGNATFNAPRNMTQSFGNGTRNRTQTMGNTAFPTAQEVYDDTFDT